MGLKLATLAYVKHNGHTLMLHKAKGYQKGKWNGLGGKFLAAESAEDCLKREVFEESGLVVEQAQLHGFISFPDFDGQDDWHTFIYTVSKFSGDLNPSDEGDLHWIKDDELFSLDLYDGDRVFLPWLGQDKFFSAKFIYQRGEFMDYSVAFY